ncbi:MAG: extracellular solute-binding protein [Candidatus Omnitrophica bacterium]|nr:extracellular solute-binding protein [Candidatus Omnitrophota bacterium]
MLLPVICGLMLLAVSGCGSPVKPVDQIEVWHWMTDRHDVLEQLAKQYEQETGIKVKLELFAPSDAYTQKIIAAAQANVLPDIYGILDKKSIVAAFIKAGFVMDLTPAYQANNGAWEQSLFAKALETTRFAEGNASKVPPGFYGVPIDTSSIQMVYNKNLLKKAGIAKPPATFDEFILDIEALRRVGVTPFVSGFGEMWLLDCFASNYAFNIMGEQKVMQTLRGEVPYTDPDWIKVLTIFKTLRDKKAFIEGIVTKGNKYSEQDFALERAAFSFNGWWCVNVYKGMNPGLSYGVVPLPAMASPFPLKSWGGAGSWFVVNNTSRNKDKAVRFLQWLTAKEQQVFLSEKTLNLPANREAIRMIPPVLGDFAKAMDNMTHPTIWPVNEDPLVIEAFDKGLQAIIIGEKSPESVAQDVQAVKARQMAKAKK